MFYCSCLMSIVRSFFFSFSRKRINKLVSIWLPDGMHCMRLKLFDLFYVCRQPLSKDIWLFSLFLLQSSFLSLSVYRSLNLYLSPFIQSYPQFWLVLLHAVVCVREREFSVFRISALSNVPSFVKYLQSFCFYRHTTYRSVFNST